jgi:hypothetical protein
MVHQACRTALASRACRMEDQVQEVITQMVLEEIRI